MVTKRCKSSRESRLRRECSTIANRLLLARQLKDSKGISEFKAKLRSKQRALNALVEKRPLKGGVSMSTKDDGFKKITHHENWHSWAEWDGKELEDGTVMVIRWKDGTESQETVRIEEKSFEVSDMGHPYTCTDKIAYVESNQRGQKVRLKVRGLYAKLVRKPSKKKEVQTA